MNICVIPARGGSKRIPRKNIKNFCGHPMIAWSIKAARQSGCFDQIIVSTDDAEIAEISVGYGATIPFLRPSELSDDHATTKDVMNHAVNTLFSSPTNDHFICCLYATAPFVQPLDLHQSFDLLLQSRLGTVVFAATSFTFPIQRAIRLDEKGYSSAYDLDSINKRSQDLEEFFHDAGMFYWASALTWCGQTNIFNSGRPLILPSWRVQDIDTQDDWIRAELMHSSVQALIK